MTGGTGILPVLLRAALALAPLPPGGCGGCRRAGGHLNCSDSFNAVLPPLKIVKSFLVLPSTA